MKRTAIVLGIFVILLQPVFPIVTVGTVAGQSGGEVPLAPLIPAPEIDEVTPVVHSRERVVFDGAGKIDRIDPEVVVIGDRLYPLSGSVRYRSARGDSISASHIKAGRYVGYRFNAQREIREIWLMDTSGKGN